MQTYTLRTMKKEYCGEVILWRSVMAWSFVFLGVHEMARIHITAPTAFFRSM